MEEQFEIRVEETSEIAALELENEVRAQGLSDAGAIRRITPETQPGTAGDPALVTLAIAYGPQLISVISAALAAWLVAGRKRKTMRARKLVVSKESTVITEIDLEEFERTGSADSMRAALDAILKKDNQEG